MLTVEEAFSKFKSRLELNDKEVKNASARHTEVRDYMSKNFKSRSFLTGSYARWTKTKPLKDVDIFFVLDSEAEKNYKSQAPSVVVDAFYNYLAKEYGESALRKQARSVNLNFGVAVDADDNTDYRILSIDAVPAFESGSNYEIPDTELGKWMKTNPEIHAEKATKAHQAFSSEWKGLVRMVKYWNNNPKHGADKPIKPSFLIEVMALECLHAPWGGRFDREIQAFFATLANRIMDDWPDPAGLGPHVSNGMDQARKERAKGLLTTASDEANKAIDLVRKNRNGDALKAWRELFGPKFPLS